MSTTAAYTVIVSPRRDKGDGDNGDLQEDMLGRRGHCEEWQGGDQREGGVDVDGGKWMRI